MAQKLEFEDLLQSASPDDVGELENELEELKAEEEAIQERLAKVRKAIREVEGKLTAPVRSAIQAARTLGIGIPKEYENVTIAQGSRSAGKFVWHAEGLEPKQQEPSRAMWRLSRGSGGSAGSNGEGVLKVDEFWSLVDEQCGVTEADLKVGDSFELTLPNERKLRVEKVEG